MSHAGSGHTDKATINARRPITDTMRELLVRLGRAEIAVRHVERGDKNRIRALVERGLAVCPGDFAAITPAGREALK